MSLLKSETDEKAEVIGAEIETLTVDDIVGFAKGLNPRAIIGTCGDALECVVSHYMERRFPEFEFCTVPEDCIQEYGVGYDGTVYFHLRDKVQETTQPSSDPDHYIDHYINVLTWLSWWGYRTALPSPVQELATFFDSLKRGAQQRVTAGRFVREVESRFVRQVEGWIEENG